MTQPQSAFHENYPDAYHDDYSKTIFGFWVYLLTDFMLFATIFAAYAVLHNNTFGGPSVRDIVHLDFTVVQTLVLLTASFVAGLAGAFAHRKNTTWTIILFALTFLIGLIFVGMQFSELANLINSGNSWKNSAFLSVFFSIIGMHMLHMIFGLLWIIVLLIPVCMWGLTFKNIKRLTCLRMFWQFLNIVWVFIFTIVYLIGVAL